MSLQTWNEPLNKIASPCSLQFVQGVALVGRFDTRFDPFPNELRCGVQLTEQEKPDSMINRLELYFGEGDNVADQVQNIHTI